MVDERDGGGEGGEGTFGRKSGGDGKSPKIDTKLNLSVVEYVLPF